MGQLEVLKILNDQGKMKAKEISIIIGLTHHSTVHNLRRLKKHGFVEFKHSNCTYTLTDKGKEFIK